MFIQAALFAAQMWLGEATRQRPKKATFEEFKESNGPSEIRPIPYIAGTEEIIPSRIWYGDFSQRAVERDSHWTDYLWAGALAFLLDTITVAYRYYCGECFALCFGPDAHVEAIKISDRLVYQATVPTDNAGGGFLIDDPQAWGGDQPPGEGGQYSWCDITRGNYTDPTNAYLESILTTAPNKTPALRGVSLLISRGASGFTESGYFAAGGVGFTPRFKEWKVTVRRQPNNLATAFSKIGRHANPMEVWYEHATSLEYGAKAPAEELNITSLQAAAETLHGEDLGWSGKITNPTSPIEVCKNIEAQIDAVADPSPSLGLTIRLIRRDYSFGSLPEMDQDVVKEVERFSPGTYEDTVNKIIVPFGDQDNNFAERPGLYIDPANVTIQGGRVVPQTQDYLGVADYATANLLATRDGRALSIPRASFVGSVKRSWGKERYRGEVVRFTWSNPTFSLLMRITELTPGNALNPHYRLVAIEDQFATGLRTFGEPEGSEHSDPAVGLDTAPPSATWNTADFPPDGLTQDLVLFNTNQFAATITGGIVFGAYAPGGQYARVWVTEPGGVQTLSPIHLAPDENNEATFTWPANAAGPYEFCIQTFSLHQVTNEVKVCAEITIAVIGSPSVSPSASVSPSISPSSSVSRSVSASVSGSQSASISPSSSVSPSGPPTPPTADLAFEWYADDEGGADESALTQLTDTSGNANHATQATGAQQAVLQHNSLGGRKAAYFDGSKRYTFTTPITSTSITVYAVYRATSGLANLTIVGGETADNGMVIAEGAGAATSSPIAQRIGTGTILTGTTLYRISRWSQMNMERTSGGDYSFRVNQLTNGTATDTDAPGPLREIGTFDTGTANFIGHLSALLIYTGEHDTSTREDVEAYLHDYFNDKIGTQRVAWLKANDLGLAGGADVTSFTDKSGHANHFFLPATWTAPTFETGVLDSQAGVRFINSSTSGLESRLFLPAVTDYSIYIVYNYRSGTSAGRRAVNGITGNWLIGPYNNKHQMFAGSFADGGALTQNVFVLAHCIGNSYRLGGTTIGSAGATVPGFVGLGSKGQFAEPLDGDIVEIIIEEENNDSTEETAIKSYFASEYPTLTIV